MGGRLRDEIGKATSEAPNPREQVRAGFVAYFTFVAKQRTAFQLLFGGGTRRDVEFADAVRSVEQSIAESIAALIDVDGLEPVSANCSPMASSDWPKERADTGWPTAWPAPPSTSRSTSPPSPGPVSAASAAERCGADELLEDGFGFDLERHVLADEEAAGLERLVPADAELARGRACRSR